MSVAAQEALSLYTWPGNVRELSAFIEYSLALIQDAEIDLADLHPKILEIRKSELKANSSNMSFYASVASFEASLLKSEYQRLEGNVSKIALTLGMDRSHLHTKLKLYGIHLTKDRGNQA